MTREKLTLLFAEADRERLQPVLGALREKGLQLRETGKEPGRQAVVLAVLSEAFYADEALCERLLGLIGSGSDNVLPLQIDFSPIPSALKNALYARNIIPAADREAELIADRIISALPSKKGRFPLLLTLLGIALLAVIAVLIINSVRKNMTAEDTGFRLPPSLALNQADLEAIRYVYIFGESVSAFTEADVQNGFEYPASFAYDEDGAHWYSREDGHELHRTVYTLEDLRFLEHLPNLEGLDLMLADTDMLPDFSKLSSFSWLEIADGTLKDISGLAGSSVHDVHVMRCPIEDYSPLSECPQLDSLILYMEGMDTLDLSGCSPPALTRAALYHGSEGNAPDLSGLGRCGKLKELTITDFPVQDLDLLKDLPALEKLNLQDLPELSRLDFEKSCSSLKTLFVENCPSLRDIGSVSDLKELTDLELRYCGNIRDYSPISGCTALERIHFQCDDNPDGLRDASFLRDLPKLNDLGLYGCNLRDLNFLEGIAAHQEAIRFGFAGDILDYSGLASVKHFSFLHVNPRYQRGDRGGDFSAVLPYIRDARVDHLMLYRCSGADLSLLPDGIEILAICYGDLKDLSGLKPYRLSILELLDCPYLTSLNGLENLPSLHGQEDHLDLKIYGCPRLADCSALDGADLAFLSLTGTYFLPDFSRFTADRLRLDSIPDLTDLQALSNYSADREIQLELAGLDAITDLSPLHHLNGGHLTVPPQVADQAEDLVADGVFRSWEVAWPDGSWQPLNDPVNLLTLDELATLPKAILQHVERLWIAGDRIVDPDQTEIREIAGEDGTVHLFLFDRITEELAPVSGDILPDLHILAGLGGLRELRFYGQSLQTLDGVQALSSLETLCAVRCPQLTDVSAAFAVQGLHLLDLHGCPFRTLAGVQNLFELEELDIRYTNVTDLLPLEGADSLRHVHISAEMAEIAGQTDFGFELEIEENENE